MRKRKPNDLVKAFALRVPEAASLYGVGADTLFRAIQRGELEASKLGIAARSPVVVTHEAMTRLLKLYRVKPTKPTTRRPGKPLEKRAKVTS